MCPCTCIREYARNYVPKHMHTYVCMRLCAHSHEYAHMLNDAARKVGACLRPCILVCLYANAQNETCTNEFVTYMRLYCMFMHAFVCSSQNATNIVNAIVSIDDVAVYVCMYAYMYVCIGASMLTCIHGHS
jgi:hypothetical protein